MQSTVDAVITYRILKILTTPWANQKAYHLGIIDAHGNPLKKSSELQTQAEKDAYTLLHRLVFRLKRIIEKVPVTNKQFVSYAAALALIKECHTQDIEPIALESIFLEIVDDDQDISVVENFINSQGLKSFSQFCEDAAVVAANSTANVVGTGDDNQTVVVKKKNKPTILKRSVNNVVVPKA